MKVRSYVAAVAAFCCSANIVMAKDIVGTAKDAGQFAMLLKAADAAGMTTALQGPGPFTIFAPTDAAFQALPAGTVERLMKPENKQELAKVLGYHLLTGRLTSTDVSKTVGDGTKKAAVATAINAPVTLSKGENGLMVNDAHIVQADVKADNGVVQVIDKVLMPAMPIQPKF
jgi:uncharacterized surface protein with fasciclin (FAS1) repeats